MEVHSPGGRKGCSLDTSSGCSTREPELASEHPYGDSQPFTSPVSEALMLGDSLLKHYICICDVHMHIQNKTN